MWNNSQGAGAPPPLYGAQPYLVAPPPVQTMSADLTLAPGVVVRQVSTWAEVWLQAAGLPYEAENKYTVAILPTGKAVAQSPNDPAAWRPTKQELDSLPLLFRVEVWRLGAWVVRCVASRQLSQ